MCFFRLLAGTAAPWKGTPILETQTHVAAHAKFVRVEAHFGSASIANISLLQELQCSEMESVCQDRV